MNRAVPLLAVAAVLGSAPAAAVDFNPLGLYAGGAAGQSQLRGDLDSFTCGFDVCSGPIPPARFSRHATGWEASLGLRPLPFLGLEAQYIDFGASGATGVFENINRSANTPGIGGSATTHPTAAALFAVGYLPIPLPYLDVYAKAGVAELRSNIDFSGLLGVCAGPPVCDPVGSLHASGHGTAARPAYGAGVQLKLGRVAVRTQYERISANTGDPALLSIGATWMF